MIRRTFIHKIYIKHITSDYYRLLRKSNNQINSTKSITLRILANFSEHSRVLRKFRFLYVYVIQSCVRKRLVAKHVKYVKNRDKVIVWWGFVFWTNLKVRHGNSYIYLVLLKIKTGKGWLLLHDYDCFRKCFLIETASYHMVPQSSVIQRAFIVTKLELT